jgi:S-adenosylmethionine/arginine decarboxylase-like enzyme
MPKFNDSASSAASASSLHSPPPHSSLPLLHSHHWSAVLIAKPDLYQWSESEFLHQMGQAIQQAGLTAVGELAFTFQPQGISAVVLLAESHIALHFWPEKGKISVDIHICDFHQDNQSKAQQLVQAIAIGLSNQTAEWQSLSVKG